MVGKGELRMAKKYRKGLEDFPRILEILVDESAKGVPIVVEGVRDKAALRKIGVKGEIIVFRSFKSLREYFETRDIRCVILLLDLDSEGERMTMIAKKTLEGVVRNIDTSLWKRLKKFRNIGLTEIESLPIFAERINIR